MTLAYQPVYLGKNITIKALRDYILDNELTDCDTVLMAQMDFDELALEYRHLYRESLPEPYLLLGVLIREAASGLTRSGIVWVIKNDTESVGERQIGQIDPHRLIYRCEYCKQLVDENGEELDPIEFKRNGDYLEKFGDEVRVYYQEGCCCQQKSEFTQPTAQVIRSDRNSNYVEGKVLMDLVAQELPFKMNR